ncbi:MAG: hypothetical protein PQJ50_04010 [Spirochaetales bacterium]|nr:hypothetical protein [Spirochaetales bacterium]
MKSGLLRLCILLIFTVAFSSCLSLNSSVNHQRSGAGSLNLDYRLNKKAVGIQKDSVTGSNLIPLPLNETDFQQISSAVPGITLRSFSETEDSDYVYITAALDYQSLDDLARLLGISIDYEYEGTRGTMTLRIYESDSPVDSNTMAVLDSVFADDSLEFEFTLPAAVDSSNYGTINGRTVSYKVNLPDIYRQDDFIWTMEW